MTEFLWLIFMVRIPMTFKFKVIYFQIVLHIAFDHKWFRAVRINGIIIIYFYENIGRGDELLLISFIKCDSCGVQFHLNIHIRYWLADQTVLHPPPQQFINFKFV